MHSRNSAVGSSVHGTQELIVFRERRIAINYASLINHNCCNFEFLRTLIVIELKSSESAVDLCRGLSCLDTIYLSPSVLENERLLCW